jgi:IS5 family transposase
MERVCPWARWIAVIEPKYFPGERGRPPIGVARMLRMYCVQQWFGLSDELVEDAIYDSQALRHLVGIEWQFGMKTHIGADAESGLVHSLHTTAANESDVAHAHLVLHGLQARAHLDAGYTGVQKRDEVVQAQQRGEIRADIEWQVASKRGKIKQMPEGPLKDLVIAVERTKAQIRARVEHPFHVVKNLFHYKKVRYKGLAKNTSQLYSLFGLANLVIAEKKILVLQAQGASCMR